VLAGWQLDDDRKRATPYFVRAVVTNRGRTDLGGVEVPLYVVDGRNVLIEAQPFASTFAPCPSTPLPPGFVTGDRIQVCLVYLAPESGLLTSVSFRPSQAFDPVLWRGVVGTYVPAPGAGGAGDAG
ncbi:hypothetical protein, partial [Bradyrhizobium sp. NBAIM08]|uniref:hypothetical protein n=1 Tax=Bradyrhizobium sp. NBAIM08 TaxID=2793815 RepID=UPI001CD5B01E